MDEHDRIRRLDSIAKEKRPPSVQRAMVKRPSLVAFQGAVVRPAPTTGVSSAVPANDTESRPLRKIESPRNRVEDGATIDEEHAEPVPVEAYTASVVAAAAEMIAMLAEHRSTRSMKFRPSREERILALVDAILASGERAIVDLHTWWQGARSTGNAWAIWPVVFLLGSLEGPEGLRAIETLLEELGVEEALLGRIAADALSSVVHPEVRLLAQDLAESARPIAQGVGIEALSRRGLLEVDRLAALLTGSDPPVLAAALRALVRAPEADRPLARLRALMDHPDPEVAWEAARALTLEGASDVVVALRDGQGLASLGAKAAEILVIGGVADDIAELETIVIRGRVAPELLLAIGRFGNPLAWSFLLHFLSDPELGDSAQEALLTLFGALVRVEEHREPAAWRKALSERDFDPSIRYRRGEPWTLAMVVRECLSGEHSRFEVERRLDEIAARTGLVVTADFGCWTPTAGPALAAILEKASGRRWPPGAWIRPR